MLMWREGFGRWSKARDLNSKQFFGSSALPQGRMDVFIWVRIERRKIDTMSCSPQPPTCTCVKKKTHRSRLPSLVPYLPGNATVNQLVTRYLSASFQDGVRNQRKFKFPTPETWRWSKVLTASRLPLSNPQPLPAHPLQINIDRSIILFCCKSNVQV